MNLFTALVMTEFAAFAAFIVADHSFGQAPDNSNKRAPKQHFSFCQFHGHDPSHIHLIHCRYGISLYGIHDSTGFPEVTLTLRVSAELGREFERTTQTASIALDRRPDLTNSTASKGLSTHWY